MVTLMFWDNIVGGVDKRRFKKEVEAARRPFGGKEHVGIQDPLLPPQSGVKKKNEKHGMKVIFLLILFLIFLAGGMWFVAHFCGDKRVCAPRTHTETITPTPPATPFPSAPPVAQVLMQEKSRDWKYGNDDGREEYNFSSQKKVSGYATPTRSYKPMAERPPYVPSYGYGYRPRSVVVAPMPFQSSQVRVWTKNSRLDRQAWSPRARLSKRRNFRYGSWQRNRRQHRVTKDPRRNRPCGPYDSRYIRDGCR